MAFKLSFPKPATAGAGEIATGGFETQTRAPVAGSKPANEPKRGKGGFVIPLVGRLPIEKQWPILATLAVLFVVITIGVVIFDARESRNSASYATATAEMRFHAQRMAKAAADSTTGNANAFAQLADSRERFAKSLTALINGGELGGDVVPPSPESVQPTLAELDKRWKKAQSQSKALLDAQKDLVNLGVNVRLISSGSAQLSELSDELVGLMAQAGAGTAQLLLADKLAAVAQRMGRGANELLGAENVSPEVAFLLGKDANTYREILKGLDEGSDTLRIPPLKDPDSRTQLQQLKGVFQKFSANADNILQNIQKLSGARVAGRELLNASEPIVADLTKAAEIYDSEKGTGMRVVVAVVFGMLALATFILIGYLFLSDARKRAAAVEEENKRNQEAILRLLNEMGDLADGDLTVRAKVTEDITGAIADSMNYTIEELRTLVTGVNRASAQVTERSQEAQHVSAQLLAAAERQSKEIEETSSRVLQVSHSISDVSVNAEESARVAQRSLHAAEKGAQAVQNSISGMNEIREQIQETSKRIKRLGESSQEIGEIVELISDITEQTNVLALNAAIQAASAGEAGRGFSVVAEEVQRLAERSGEATKQIGAIVRTIQLDTQDAVSAMEKSTQGVVEGAKLSDAAGQALSEIGQVSKQLADLIQTISKATQTQADATGQVAANMQAILEITRQTTAGTQQTAVSVQNLTQVASELKSSVSGFRL
jgi:twitching motility protein PilJ